MNMSLEESWNAVRQIISELTLEKGTKVVYVPANFKRKAYQYEINYDGISGKQNTKSKTKKNSEEINTEFKNKIRLNEIKGLKICTDEQFSKYVDAMFNHDYKSIPAIIRMPDLNGKLTQKLHLANVHCYMMKGRFSHISPARKQAYNQDLRIDEYKLIPQIIKNAKKAYVSVQHKNFTLFSEDKQNKDMINTIAFNKDVNGNYLVTVGKKLKESFGKGCWKLVEVGVAPTIHGINKSRPATSLLASSISPSIPSFNKSVTQKNYIVNKSVNITISDITEGNKDKKLLQLSKALNCLSQGKKPQIKRIKADGTERLPNIELHLKRIEKNRIIKAISGTAMLLKSTVPVKGEAFTFQSHKDMMEKINNELSQLSLKTYSFVQEYFGLPEITTMSKAEMRWKGKIIYSPETGKPITQKEWEAFVEALEKFMNRNYSGLGNKWTLSAEAMGRLLDRMVKYQSFDEVTKTPLGSFKYGTKTYDWISDSVKNLKTTMGDSLTREQQARIEIAQQSTAQRVTSATDSAKNKIQQIVIDGIRDRKSRTQVSQNLFDACASMNRDMQRIADTEYQMAMNRAYIAEELHNTPEGEKVYFKRFEVLDDHTCTKCKKLKDKIAVWSNTPLTNERVRDEHAIYAIWEGKTEGEAPIDILHPWCRGSWIRWNAPATKKSPAIDAFNSYMDGLKDNWDKAVKQAKEEWSKKGIANPTDKTPGYYDRVREIYNNFNKK